MGSSCSCIFGDIYVHILVENQFFSYPSCIKAYVKVLLSEFCNADSAQKTRIMGLSGSDKSSAMCTHYQTAKDI